MLNLKEIFSVSIILFSVIDIVGSIPIIIDLRNKSGKIESLKATLVAGVIMIVFLYLGKSILNLFGLDVESFALAGALIIFLLGMEMVLGKDLFKTEANTKTTSIVPLAFPLIAGAGTMTTILTLRSEYHHFNVLVGILINLILVFLVLKTSTWIEQKLGKAGTDILRKVFGIILLAIAIKIFKSNWHF
ncbi:MAG: MarC family protein [Flammeovirgaceae bacterium]|nr:MarC family protein [Flammeovirgaceae bacterium]